MHAIERGQVFTVFYGVLCPFEYVLHRVIGQGVQPEFLDLLDLLGIGKCGVVLVVVIQSEQGKDLVDGLDMRRGVTVATISLPMRCL